MIVLRTVDLRNGFKRISKIISSGEKVMIVRPHNENLIVISENEYYRLEKGCKTTEQTAKNETTEAN